MEDRRSEAELGRGGAWKGRLQSLGGGSLREEALTGGRTVGGTAKGKEKRGSSSVAGGKTVGGIMEGKSKRGRLSVAVAVGDVHRTLSWGATRARTKSRKLQEEHGQQQLLPGIPDEITLDLITTKLPLTDVLALPQISRAWQQAVHSREVYQARVRALATESLRVVHRFDLTSRACKVTVDFGSRCIGRTLPGSRYFCRTLPPIPAFWARNHDIFYRHMCFDGKIYSLVVNCHSISAIVYVLDPAGRRQWTQCALRQLELSDFRATNSLCCIKDGKFYISGVLSVGAIGLGHMIYDPMLDSWSSTTDFRLEASTQSCICSRSSTPDFRQNFLAKMNRRIRAGMFQPRRCSGLFLAEITQNRCWL